MSLQTAAGEKTAPEKTTNADASDVPMPTMPGKSAPHGTITEETSKNKRSEIAMIENRISDTPLPNSTVNQNTPLSGKAHDEANEHTSPDNCKAGGVPIEDSSSRAGTRSNAMPHGTMIANVLPDSTFSKNITEENKGFNNGSGSQDLRNASEPISTAVGTGRPAMDDPSATHECTEVRKSEASIQVSKDDMGSASDILKPDGNGDENKPDVHITEVGQDTSDAQLKKIASTKTDVQIESDTEMTDSAEVKDDVEMIDIETMHNSDRLQEGTGEQDRVQSKDSSKSQEDIQVQGDPNVQDDTQMHDELQAYQEPLAQDECQPKVESRAQDGSQVQDRSQAQDDVEIQVDLQERDNVQSQDDVLMQDDLHAQDHLQREDDRHQDDTEVESKVPLHGESPRKFNVALTETNAMQTNVGGPETSHISNKQVVSAGHAPTAETNGEDRIHQSDDKCSRSSGASTEDTKKVEEKESKEEGEGDTIDAGQGIPLTTKETTNGKEGPVSPTMSDDGCSKLISTIAEFVASVNESNENNSSSSEIEITSKSIAPAIESNRDAQDYFPDHTAIESGAPIQKATDEVVIIGSSKKAGIKSETSSVNYETPINYMENDIDLTMIQDEALRKSGKAKPTMKQKRDDRMAKRAATATAANSSLEQPPSDQTLSWIIPYALHQFDLRHQDWQHKDAVDILSRIILFVDHKVNEWSISKFIVIPLGDEDEGSGQSQKFREKLEALQKRYKAQVRKSLQEIRETINDRLQDNDTLERMSKIEREDFLEGYFDGGGEHVARTMWKPVADIVDWQVVFATPSTVSLGDYRMMRRWHMYLRTCFVQSMQLLLSENIGGDARKFYKDWCEMTEKEGFPKPPRTLFLPVTVTINQR
ncbi:MAG: hypothetical protein Q9165_001395 [Trypethelium subeluteriae]